MSAQPITKAELMALHELGYEWLTEGGSQNNIVEVYRAGFRDGRKSPQPRVFRAGDPEPGPEITSVLDRDDDIWVRGGYGWGLSADGATPWAEVVDSYGPLVACSPLPDWLAAVKADGGQAAGCAG